MSPAVVIYLSSRIRVGVKGGLMKDTKPVSDRPVLARIQELVDEEHSLFSKGAHRPSEGADLQRLSKVRVELDQCWDLLRQRRALRVSQGNPDTAQVRPADIVENYEQ